MPGLSRRAVAAALWALIVVLFVGGTAFGASSGATERGLAEIVGTDGSTPLNAGGSSTPFSIKLPSGAACPGDTMHRFYLIDSYVEPVGTDLSTVSFRGGYPKVGVNLISVNGVPYVSTITDVNTGDVPGLPEFSWSRYDHDPADLPPGTYDVGIVCQDHFGDATSFWNTEVTFKKSSTDPGGFTWTVVKGFQGKAASSHTLLIVGIVVIVIALTAGAYLLGSGRQRRSLASAKR